MPDIGETIRTHVLADGTVSGLVGTRMYPEVLPQGATLPAITHMVVSALPYNHLGGIVDIARARIQIDCFAKTRGDANTLADAVRLQLSQYRGTVSSQYVNEISMISGPEDRTDPREAGTDQRRYVTSMDFFVFYRTTTS